MDPVWVSGLAGGGEGSPPVGDRLDAHLENSYMIDHESMTNVKPNFGLSGQSRLTEKRD